MEIETKAIRLWLIISKHVNHVRVKKLALGTFENLLNSLGVFEQFLKVLGSFRILKKACGHFWDFNISTGLVWDFCLRLGVFEYSPFLNR